MGKIEDRMDDQKIVRVSPEEEEEAKQEAVRRGFLQPR